MPFSTSVHVFTAVQRRKYFYHLRRSMNPHSNVVDKWSLGKIPSSFLINTSHFPASGLINHVHPYKANFHGRALQKGQCGCCISADLWRRTLVLPRRINRDSCWLQIRGGGDGGAGSAVTFEKKKQPIQLPRVLRWEQGEDVDGEQQLFCCSLDSPAEDGSKLLPELFYFAELSGTLGVSRTHEVNY